MWWESRLHDSNIDVDHLVHLKILRPCVRQLVMLNGHLSHLLGLSSNHLWRIYDKVGWSYHDLSASIKIWACRSPSSWSRSQGPCRAQQVASDSQRCTCSVCPVTTRPCQRSRGSPTTQWKGGQWLTTLRHKHTNLGVLESRKSKVLRLDLSKILETKSCFFLLRVGKTAVWNHHYLASSGPGHQDDHGSELVIIMLVSSSIGSIWWWLWWGGDEEHLPAATPRGASSKTRQSPGFSLSSLAATWYLRFDKHE